MIKNQSKSKSSSNSNEHMEDKNNNQILLIGIVAAIIIGIAVGGWLPDIAVKFAFLGEIFLNLLMMLVIPLVMLSMIVGITRLGDIRNLGPIGGKTVLYYLTTTGISVLIGIILVNIIRPGDGISPGEKHPDFLYTIGGDNNRTVFLTEGELIKSRYNDKYMIMVFCPI